MGKINKEIKNNYSQYKELLANNKHVDDKVIILDGLKKNHFNTRQKHVKVEHPTIQINMELLIESNIENKKDFKFKLRASELTGEPFFRFDSDGPSHCNPLDEVSLSESKIDTPHFHKFDEKGRNIAYKTPALLNEKQTEVLLNDVSLCMAHYCDESKTFSNQQYIEIIQTPSNELDFETDEFNPLEGVKYE